MNTIERDIEAARQGKPFGSGSAQLIGYAKDVTAAPAVTLSSLMGRIQATIDNVDGMIKSAGASVSLLVGPHPTNALGGTDRDPPMDDGVLNMGERLLNTLTGRLNELQSLQDTIARRLS